MKTSETPSSNTPRPNYFVTSLSLDKAKKLKEGLIEKGFDLSTPSFTLFSGRKKGISCTLYTSGKLVIQGSEIQEFIEFYLEPEILGTLDYSINHYVETLPSTQNLFAHIGIDESGKGDFFGPLCIAGVYASEKEIPLLSKIGVKDSKTLNEASIVKIANEIKKTFAHSVICISPLKYNELYEKFKNLNELLAWGHATAIENLAASTNCHVAMIDQFAAEHVVISALRRKKIEIELTQKHRGEEDLVVAAASILARQAFVENLKKLSEKFEIELPKGASNKTIQIGKKFKERYGKEALKQVCKWHFKTLDAL